MGATKEHEEQQEQRSTPEIVNASSEKDREKGFFGVDAQNRKKRVKAAAQKVESVVMWLCTRLGREGVEEKLGPLEYLHLSSSSSCSSSLQDLLGKGGGEGEDDEEEGERLLHVLHLGLKDGVLLCYLSNHLVKNSCKKIVNPTKNVLQERQNIMIFLQTLSPHHHLRPEEHFTLSDLHSEKDMPAVVSSLLSLRRVVQTGIGAFTPQKLEKQKQKLKGWGGGRMKLGDGGAKGEGVEAVNKAGGEMTERGFFGMDAEVQKRLEKKSDSKRMKLALEWVRLIVGASAGDRYLDLREVSDLCDGVALCALANLILPGSVKKYHKRSRMKMFHRENIQLFLSACLVIGVSELDLFTLSDLADLKYPGGVVNTIFALSRAASNLPN